MSKATSATMRTKRVSEPLVSIIIPVYNTSKYLKKCLESIFSQTYQNIETIVVNDGSTDDSMKILNSIKREHPEMIIVNQRNSGGVIARRNGIKKASGEYILLEDSDDWLENDLVEKCINIIKNDKSVDVVKFGFIAEPSKKKYNLILDGIIKQKTLMGREIETVLKRLIYSSDCNNVWNEMVRRSLYNFNDSIYNHIVRKGEDAQINLQIWQKIQKAVFLEDCPYHYVNNPNGITNSFGVQKVINDINDSIYLNEIRKAIAIKKFGYVDESALIDRTMSLLSNRIVHILAFSKSPKADMLFIQTSLEESLRSFLGEFDVSTLNQNYLYKKISVNVANGHNMKNMKYKTICKTLMRIKRRKNEKQKSHI